MIGSAISHSPYHTTIIIMLNLAEPEVLWSVLEESLAVTRSAMKMSYSPESIDSLVSRRTTEMKNCAEKIEIFPMNLCIIGGNYDRFMVREAASFYHLISIYENRTPIRTIPDHY